MNKINNFLDSSSGKRIVILATAVILILIVFQSIRPAMSKKSEAAKQEQATLVKVADTKREIAALAPQLAKQKASNLSESLNTALPAEVVGDEQFAVLSRLADQTNVEFPTFEPGEPDAEGSAYRTVPANLAIKGSLENCLRFIGGLNSLVTVKGEDQVTAYGPIWAVKQISLAPGESGSDDVSMTLTSGFYIQGTDANKKGSQPSDAQGQVQ